MGIAVVGGTVAATLLTLLVTTVPPMLAVHPRGGGDREAPEDRDAPEGSA